MTQEVEVDRSPIQVPCPRCGSVLLIHVDRRSSYRRRSRLHYFLPCETCRYWFEFSREAPALDAWCSNCLGRLVETTWYDSHHADTHRVFCVACGRVGTGGVAPTTRLQKFLLAWLGSLDFRVGISWATAMEATPPGQLTYEAEVRATKAWRRHEELEAQRANMARRRLARFESAQWIVRRADELPLVQELRSVEATLEDLPAYSAANPSERWRGRRYREARRY